MFKYYPIIAITAVLIISFACQRDKDVIVNPAESVPSDSLFVPFSPIDTEIVMYLRETIESSGRPVSLGLYSLRLYSPAGAKIIGEIAQSGNSIKLVLTEISHSGPGAAISVPARAEFDVDIAQSGTFNLEIRINGAIIPGLITVANDKFSLIVQPNNIIHTSKVNLNRIPETIIWGQAESKAPEPFQLFLDSLIILGASEHQLQPGDYRYFAIDSLGGFHIPSSLGMAYGRHYLYNFEADTLLSRNLVKRFAKTYRDSIYIKLFGGRGEEYFSTTLKNEPW